MTSRLLKEKGPETAGRWPRIVKHGSAEVKIYRFQQKTFAAGFAYVLRWYGPEGIEQRKFARFAEAESEARLIAARIAVGEVELAGMKKSDFQELARARQIAGDTPLLAALREWQKIQELTNGNGLAAAEVWSRQNAARFDRLDVAEAVERFIASKGKAKKQGERTYRAKLKPLLAAFPGRTIDSISAAEFSRYLENWGDGVTRNDIRKRTVALCRWAQNAGYIPAGVRLEIEATERAAEEAAEVGTISADYLRDLLNWTRAEHPELLAGLVLAAFCALRVEEVHGKRDGQRRQLWSDIDLERRHLNVTNAKKNTARWRLVELPEAAVAWLKICPRPDPEVIPAKGLERLRLLVRNARTEDGSPKFAPLPENAWRHSAISCRVAVTGDKAATATWAGTSVQKIDSNYRRPLTREAGLAWFNVFPAEAAQVIPFERKAGHA